jgi:Ca-activated chloride channel family protein
MKKLLIILLLGIFIFTLTACHGDYFDSATGGMANSEPMNYPESMNEMAFGSDDWRFAEFEESESYNFSVESPFINALTSPLSTFSASPNTASYSNMRRFINMGQKPPVDSIRIEEMINYFDYDYRKPNADDDAPFSINAEVAVSPWNENNLLAKIGIQGKDLRDEDRLANNVVFLIDVSGSMNRPDRLPLVQESFIMLIDQLNENDIISIVTYAGNDRVVADSMSGDRKNELKDIISNLHAAGSTAGSKGIQTAYELAEKNFITGGNNRVILATDGDFNVGITGRNELKRFIEEKTDTGVFLSVLGYGMGNLKDDTMENLAKYGNGNYAYIDTLEEAKKVIVHEFDATMYVIAKDLKLQVEFNPAVVAEYRLIGYDNRRLNNEDFDNDQKDAGDIGAGFSVTAFYEIVLVSEETDGGSLRYQNPELTDSDDFFTVSVRFKEPDGHESSLVELVVGAGYFTENPSGIFNFASAVTEFGLILMASQFAGSANTQSVITRASENLGDDRHGLKAEFVQLVQEFERISE